MFEKEVMSKICSQKCKCNLEPEAVFKYSLLIKVQSFERFGQTFASNTDVPKASQVNIDFS